MFTTPFLQPGERFPTLPLDTPNFRDLITELQVPLHPGHDVLPQLVAQARGLWLNWGAAAGEPGQMLPYAQAKQYGLLETVGLIHGIEPHRNYYDHVLVDGGSKRVFDYRLDWLDQHVKQGITNDITIFAGQRLRFRMDDSTGRLEDIARELYPSCTGWARKFLATELAKDPYADNPWDRSFASEQEIATLTLIQRYGHQLIHTRTVKRKDYKSEVSHIPDAKILAEEFQVGDVTMRVLYGKAVRRSYAGQTPAVPRPTARSCFNEWLEMARPEHESTVLLVSHNPNIYRTWLDLMLGFNYVLRGLGSIFINYHSHIYGNDGSHLTRSAWW
jgi:hypothetical protein